MRSARGVLLTSLLGVLPQAGLAACSSPSSAPTDTNMNAGTGGTAATESGNATSIARVSATDEVLGVGVVIPVKSFENVPSTDPAFQNNVGLEMSDTVRDRTFIQLLRINWLSGGHGPAPYGKPHFDLHFYRGTKDEVTAIDCDTTDPFSADILASGYEPPSTCVRGMGYHAWPSEDIANHTFSASIILGYANQEMVFIEPMITQELLLSRQSFELDITRPASAGGAPTLYPTHMTATYSAMSDTYTFEFNEFAMID